MHPYVALAARALTALVLPTLIVDHLCPAEQLVSLATGGEWLRLNASSGSEALCFGRTLSDDRRCRWPERDACESAAGDCLWASPRQPRCSGSRACAEAGTVQRACTSMVGCKLTQPLDERLSCRSQEPTAALGGPRCDAFAHNRPDALPMLRDEVRTLLYQLFLFLVANFALLQHFGSIENLIQNGKPFFIAIFLTAVAVGKIRRSYLDSGGFELRFGS